MRYVITGGSGFIGSHLVKKLQDRCEQIIVIDKLSNHINLDNIQDNNKTKYYFVDISDPNITLKIIQKGDIVFHLAAQSHVDVSFNDPLETTRSNVLGTQSIMHACLNNSAEKLIIMSTDEVYGSANTIQHSNLLDPTNPYSSSKAAADMIANSYRHMYKNFNFVTLRSNNIFGPGQFIRNIIPKFSCLGLLGKKMTMHGDGSSRRRYLWIDDAVRALLLLAEQNTHNPIYNIGHDKDYSNLEIANLIGEYLNLDDFIEFEDDRVFNDIAYPCEYNLIKDELGWEYSFGIDNKLHEVIEWYKENIDKFKPFL